MSNERVGNAWQSIVGGSERVGSEWDRLVAGWERNAANTAWVPLVFGGRLYASDGRDLYLVSISDPSSQAGDFGFVATVNSGGSAGVDGGIGIVGRELYMIQTQNRNLASYNLDTGTVVRRRISAGQLPDNARPEGIVQDPSTGTTYYASSFRFSTFLYRMIISSTAWRAINVTGRSTGTILAEGLGGLAFIGNDLYIITNATRIGRVNTTTWRVEAWVGYTSPTDGSGNRLYTAQGFTSKDGQTYAVLNRTSDNHRFLQRVNIANPPASTLITTRLYRDFDAIALP